MALSPRILDVCASLLSVRLALSRAIVLCHRGLGATGLIFVDNRANVDMG